MREKVILVIDDKDQIKEVEEKVVRDCTWNCVKVRKIINLA